MVNLNSPFPFNINNKSLSLPYGSTSPCRSMSRPSNSQESSTLPVHSALHAHIGASLGPVLHPSVSRSLSSGSPETISNHGGAFVRPPIFNLRLVQSPKQAIRAAARRGRPRMKLGGDDEVDIVVKSTDLDAFTPKPSTDTLDFGPVSAPSSVQGKQLQPHVRIYCRTFHAKNHFMILSVSSTRVLQYLRNLSSFRTRVLCLSAGMIDSFQFNFFAFSRTLGYHCTLTRQVSHLSLCRLTK